MTVEYRINQDLDVDEVIELYRSSGLGERRPVDDRRRMAAMVTNANLIVTAWDGDALVGIARSLTDRVYVTYLSDLAVAKPHQRTGVGKRLVAETVAACEPGCRLVLLSAPGARTYYPSLGFEPHPSAWVLLPNG